MRANNLQTNSMKHVDELDEARIDVRWARRPNGASSQIELHLRGAVPKRSMWSSRILGPAPDRARAWLLVALLLLTMFALSLHIQSSMLVGLFAPQLMIRGSGWLIPVGCFDQPAEPRTRRVAKDDHIGRAAGYAAPRRIYRNGALFHGGCVGDPYDCTARVEGWLDALCRRLANAEIRSAILLGLLSFVVFPLLPDRFVDPWSFLMRAKYGPSSLSSPAWVSATMCCCECTVCVGPIIRLFSGDW
jgi:hypothetical protein